MQTTFIYALTDPDTKEIRYIGKSDEPNDIRLSCHIFEATQKIENDKLKSKTYKSKWIRSLIKVGKLPLVEILDEIDFSEWEFWEKYYISLYKSWGFNLVNGTPGGDGGDTWSKNPRREWFCKRMSDRWKKNNPNKNGLRPGQKDKMIKSKIGKPIHSEEHKLNMSKRIKEEWNSGKREHIRNKLRDAGIKNAKERRGVKLTQAHKDKVSNALKNSVKYKDGRLKFQRTIEEKKKNRANLIKEYLKTHNNHETRDYFKLSKSTFFRIKRYIINNESK